MIEVAVVMKLCNVGDVKMLVVNLVGCYVVCRLNVGCYVMNW